MYVPRVDCGLWNAGKHEADPLVEFDAKLAVPWLVEVDYLPTSLSNYIDSEK